jgi:hypothetical protein
MIERILSITLPIFLIILIGLIYGRFKQPNMVGANKIILDVALPCLIFTSLSTKHFELSASLHFLSAAALICWRRLNIDHQLVNFGSASTIEQPDQPSLGAGEIAAGLYLLQ